MKSPPRSLVRAVQCPHEAKDLRIGDVACQPLDEPHRIDVRVVAAHIGANHTGQMPQPNGRAAVSNRIPIACQADQNGLRKMASISRIRPSSIRKRS